MAGSSTAPTAPVVRYACGGTADQQWPLRPGGPGYVTVVSRGSGQCLDVSGVSTTDGAAVEQWTCSGSPNQQFRAG